MPTLTVIVASNNTVLGNDGVPLLLDAAGNARATIWLDAHDGLGMAPSRRLSERGPMQQGETDRGVRYDPRMMSLAFGVSGQSMADYWDARDALYRLFRPRDTALSVRFDLDNGAARQIDGHLVGGLLGSSKDRKGFTLKLATTIKCPSPFWYDPTPVFETFGASGAAAGMGIPWAIPWQVGASSINQTRPILYTGSYQAEPIIQIVGPITSPIITNIITGDTLDFTGTTIAAGTTYTIDCRYGYKTVVDQNGTNQIAKLVSGSDLATFALLADPDAPGGVNSIAVAGTGISSATNVYLTYSRQYIGI